MASGLHRRRDRQRGDRGQEALRGLNLELHGGEIVGIAGVSGNGQRDHAEAIAGIRAPTSGSILLCGKEVAGATPAQVRAAGLAYVPEQRMRDGIISDFSVAENLLLVENRSRLFSRLDFLRARAIRRHCQDLVDAFAVKTPDIDTPAKNLSGGNVQKLVMARSSRGVPASCSARSRRGGSTSDPPSTSTSGLWSNATSAPPCSPSRRISTR